MPAKDIAIVGMACLFPGCRNTNEYWDNIVNKKYLIAKPEGNWTGEHISKNETLSINRIDYKGGFIDSIAYFDPIREGVLPKSVTSGDPDHFLSLKIARQALEDYGYPLKSYNPKRAGIVLGRGTYFNRGFGTVFQHGLVLDQTIEVIRKIKPEINDEEIKAIRRELEDSLPPFDVDMLGSVVPNLVTGRIANKLGLQGPNYLIDAACASSLIALDHAVKELASGSCDLMIAGGVQASTPPQVHMVFEKLGALASDIIIPFDDNATGTLLSEGVGMVILKRLEDACRDGDYTYAVIKDIGIASDGKSTGLFAPSSSGQIQSLEKAYSTSNIDKGEVDYIEAHGTGMPLGDKTEIETLNAFFGKREGTNRVRIGSVKSQIGHCIPAAGIASVIKTSLALSNRVYPPMLATEETRISLLKEEGTPLVLQTTAEPWAKADKDKLRTAGINAFGFGGINAHLILQEAKSLSNKSQQRSGVDKWSLWCYGANSKDSLISKIRNNERTSKETFANESCRAVIIAEWDYTVNKYRHQLISELQDSHDKYSKMGPRRKYWWSIESRSYIKEPRVAIMFPGEASEYPGMMKDLCLGSETVQDWIGVADKILQGQQNLSDYIFGERGRTLDDIKFSTASMFCMNMAIFRLWEEVGLRPDIVLGHSTGENTAVAASGMVNELTHDSRIIIKTLQRMADLFGDADEKVNDRSMYVLHMPDRAKIAEYLDKKMLDIEIAMDNCPSQIIVCANKDSSSTEAILKECSVMVTELPFKRPYHTINCEAYVDGLVKFYRGLTYADSRYRLFSSIIVDEWPKSTHQSIDLLSRQPIEKVEFSKSIEALYKQGFNVFVEVGPSSTLGGFVRDILGNKDYLCLSSDTRIGSSRRQLLASMAIMYCAGFDIDLEKYAGIDSVDKDNIESNEILLDMRMPTMGLKARLEYTDIHDLEQPQIKDQQVTGKHNVSVDESHQFKAALYNQYKQTMDVFIDNLERTAHSLLSDMQPVTNSIPFESALIEKIIRLQVPSYSLARIRIEEDRQPWLFDHALGGKASYRATHNSGLIVMPLAMAIEILVEGNKLIVDDNFDLHECRKVLSHKWIKVVSTSVIMAESKLAERDANKLVYECRLLSKDDTAEEELLISLEAIWIRSDQQSEKRIVLNNHELEGLERYKWTNEELYSHGMFHGPFFQKVRGINGVSSSSIYADIGDRRLATNKYDIIDEKFLTCPQIVDCLEQLVAFWAAVRYGNLFHTFPYYIESLKFHRFDKSSFRDIKVFGNLSMDQGNRIIASLTAFDESSRTMLLEMSGHMQVFIEIPDNYHQCFARPIDAQFSTVVTLTDTMSIRHARVMDYKLLSGKNGIIASIIEQLWLTNAEKHDAIIYKANTMRRYERVFSYKAAKEAALDLLPKLRLRGCGPLDLVIRKSPSGRPFISCVDDSSSTDITRIKISIAHINGECFAIASSTEVGIDVVDMTDNVSDDMLKFIGCSTELVNAIQGKTLLLKASDQTVTLSSLIFSAFECIGKALGTGFLPLSLAGNMRLGKMNSDSFQVDVKNVSLLINVMLIDHMIVCWTALSDEAKALLEDYTS